MSVLYASRFITSVLRVYSSNIISSTGTAGQDVQITWCYFNFQFRKNNNIRSHDLVRELCDHAIRDVYTIYYNI